MGGNGKVEFRVVVVFDDDEVVVIGVVVGKPPPPSPFLIRRTLHFIINSCSSHLFPPSGYGLLERQVSGLPSNRAKQEGSL